MVLENVDNLLDFESLFVAVVGYNEEYSKEFAG
jgi:hypothetical protein